MLDKELHVHVHNDDSVCHLITLITSMKGQLANMELKLDKLIGGDEAIKERIMDKLNKLKTDIEGTIS